MVRNLGKEKLQRTFVGSLLELAVVQSLLDKIEDNIGEGRIGERSGFGVHFGRLQRKNRNAWSVGAQEASNKQK